MNRPISREPEREAGISLLEVMIYIALMAIIGAPLAGVVLTASRGTQDHSNSNQVLERSRATLVRTGEDLRSAITDTVSVLNGGSGLQLTLPASFNGTAIVNGPTIRYDLVSAADESQNSADDNGNGLVDEGRLVRRNSFTGETIELCGNLDLTRSSFAFDSVTVTATLTTMARGTSGTTATTTRTLTVMPRN